jgi:putative cell wall-binding protein
MEARMTRATRSRPGPVSHVLLLAVIAAMLLATAPLGAAHAQQAQRVTRLTADSNTGAAIAWSRLTYAAGAGPTVLLARDDVFVDTLTTGSAQGALDAPLLLTDGDALSPDTATELERLGAQDVTIMGGEHAVSAAVEAELADLGYATTRLSGATRLETATEVAGAFFPNATTAVIARAFPTSDEQTQAFADSLAVGSFSAGTGIPVLLTEVDRLSDSTRAYLDAASVENIIVVGGTAAVSEAVMAELATIDMESKGPGAELTVNRVAAGTRFGTAVALANEFGYSTAADAPRILLIAGTGADAWASGLPAGAQSGSGAATVLADGATLPAETLALLEGGSGKPLICGPAVEASACDAAAEALGLTGS